MKTAEMTLAEVLGQVPSKTKVASALEEMSTQELADILRAEGFGKTAGLKEKIVKPFADAATKATTQAFKKHGPKVVAGAGAAGLAGGYVGGKMAKPKEKSSDMEKLSWNEKLALADQWGRELAREHTKLAANMKKKMVTDKDRAEEYSNLGARIGALRGMWHAPAGAGFGGHLASAVKGGVAGYGAGRLVHRLAHGPAKGEKLKKSSIEKDANPAIQGLVSVAKDMARRAAPMVGKGVNAVMGSSAGRRAAVGAGVGALGGALRDPGMSSTGQPKSRLGGMLGGAALGAGAGLAAKPALQRVGGMNNAVGSYIRNASMQAKAGMPAARRMLPTG